MAARVRPYGVRAGPRAVPVPRTGHRLGMPAVVTPEPVVKLVQRTTEPAAAQTLRSTAAAVIAFAVAQSVLPEPHPAPLTAPSPPSSWCR